MKRSVAMGASARRAWLAAKRFTAALAAFITLGQPASAGDRALIDIIGFSEDGGRYFAFEEYGISDGAGFPYSTLYVVDLSTDSWAPGSPYRAQGEDEQVPLTAIRAEVRAAAADQLEALKIDVPGQVVALLGDGELGTDGTSMRFGVPSCCGIGSTEGDYTLALEIYPADSPEPCLDYIGEKGKGFALTISGDGASRELHRDASLPKSRGCPLGYQVYAVVTPYDVGGLTQSVAIIATYPFGFEGPDRRFIAVPIRF